MATRLSPSELHQRVIDAISQGGGIAREISHDSHSFVLEIEDGTEIHQRRLYVRNLTHGGGNRNLHERRIQLRDIGTPAPLPTGSVVFLGWSEAEHIFAGFDTSASNRMAGLSKSPSIQVREQTLETAAERGIAAQTKRNEVVICTRPDVLLSYLRDPSFWHSNPEEIDPIVTHSLSAPAPIPASALPQGRLRSVVLLQKAVRRSDFRREVLAAYDHACAVCGTQLGLVEAAHIVPVREPTSTDEIANGIALCKQHHSAYDQGLILINGRGEISLNPKKLDPLGAANLHGGLPRFKASLSRKIRVLKDPGNKPDPSYLKRGKELRQ